MAALALIETAAAIAGPGVLFARRAWYGVCVIAGFWTASESGQTPGHDEAFAIGRPLVISTIRRALYFEIEHVEWRKIAAGLNLARKRWREHARNAWRGVKRDFRVLRDWALRRRPDRRAPEVQDIHEGLLRANALFESDPHLAAKVTADHMIDVHDRIGALAQRKDLKPAEIRTLQDLHTLVKEWKDNIVKTAAPDAPIQPAFAAQKQGLIGAALASPAMAQAGAVVGGIILASWAVIGIDQVRIHAIKAEARNYKADNAAMRRDLADRDGRVKALRAQVAAQNVQCVRAQINAADVQAKQAARARAAALSARKRIANAAASPPIVFDLDRALASLREPARAPQPEPGAGSASAANLAQPMLHAPDSDARPAASGPAAAPRE